MGLGRFDDLAEKGHTFQDVFTQHFIRYKTTEERAWLPFKPACTPESDARAEASN